MRGNFRSSWAAEGGCDFVAEVLFDDLDVDGFFLKYDDARSGTFEPLRFVSEGPRCGFSSTVEGNAITREQRAAKLRLIVQTAEEVWG